MGDKGSREDIREPPAPLGEQQGNDTREQRHDREHEETRTGVPMAQG